MKTVVLKRMLGVVVVLIACGNLDASAAATAPAKTLRAFDNDQMLFAHLQKMADDVDRRREWEARRRQDAANRRRAEMGLPPAASQLAPFAQKALSEPKPAGAAQDSVTNVQHAGVDEGGIVKVHGDHLVVLRRGRLFTVRMGQRLIAPISALDAYGKDLDPRGTWYDEMLISGNTIVVIGYSYSRGGTEIGLFDISDKGDLAYRATYHLRSNDYYSSRNYASRLIGNQLIFYTPLHLDLRNPANSFPAMRRWQANDPAGFRRIAPATRIYRTDEDLDAWFGMALHTVTMCDLSKPQLDCTSTAVLGPPGRVFYVSPDSVFVWTSSWRILGAEGAARSGVFRIPLDGSAPTALKTSGTPIDQFSFLESEDGHLNVLLRAAGAGEGMWGAESNVGELGLMRVPLASFGDGTTSAPRTAYRPLPTPPAGALQSRYIGAYLLYGSGNGWYPSRPQADSAVFAVRYGDPAASPQRLPLPHAVDRLEALGEDAVAIGSDGKNLHFTSLKLASRVSEAGRYIRENAAQGETRSHGFYYRAQDDAHGWVGLPVIGGSQSAAGQLRRTSASVLFLRNDGLKLSELGTLESNADANVSDTCVASCVDWYGNSRPLFLRGRVFALLGYEIVEGSVNAGGIKEMRRVSFMPHWTGRVTR